MIAQITMAQFRTLMYSSKRFTLVDTLSKSHHMREHIPGAICIPAGEIEKTAPQCLPRDELIIVYGEGFGRDDSEAVAQKLVDLGFKHVVRFPGGLEDYRISHLPVVGGFRPVIVDG